MSSKALIQKMEHLAYMVAYANYLREERGNAGSIRVRGGTIRAKLLYLCRFADWLMERRNYYIVHPSEELFSGLSLRRCVIDPILENQAWSWLQGTGPKPQCEKPSIIEVLVGCSDEDIAAHLENRLLPNCDVCGSGGVSRNTASVIQASVAHFYDMLYATGARREPLHF